MQEVPVSCGFLVFPAVGGKAVALANGLRYSAMVFNGSYWLVVTRRDKDVTWRTLGALCRERDWSKPRLLEELRNGLSYRTFPRGHLFDWYDYVVVHNLDVQASHVALAADDWGPVGIEVLDDKPTTGGPIDTARWTITVARQLRADRKTEGIKTKAGLARLLAAESEKAVKVGQIRRALKASYLEDQLKAWGIWPLSSLD